MSLKQMSIFLENSPGRLFEVTQAFGEAGINLKALSLVDTAGFGVLRVLVSDLPKARKLAMERHWPARVDEVVAARIPDVPGSLAQILKPLLDRKINVEYMYAFAGFSTSEAVMIFRFRQNEEAKKILGENGVSLVSSSEFGVLEGEEASA
jgi:hypothetical protein